MSEAGGARAARREATVVTAAATPVATLARWLAGAVPLLFGFEPLRSRNTDVEQGNAPMKAGKAEEALATTTRRCRRCRPIRRRTSIAATALYALSRFDEAGEEFLRATEARTAALKAAAFYNLGNAFFKKEKFKEAVEAYKRTLACDPRRPARQVEPGDRAAQAEGQGEGRQKQDEGQGRQGQEGRQDRTTRRQDDKKRRQEARTSKKKDRRQKKTSSKQDKHDSRSPARPEAAADQNEAQGDRSRARQPRAQPEGSREGARPPARGSPPPARRGTGDAGTCSASSCAPRARPSRAPSLAVALLGPAAAQAASFIAALDRDAVAPGEPFAYEVTLTVATSRWHGYRPPDFRGLQVLSKPAGPNRSTQHADGRRPDHRPERLHLALRARAAGRGEGRR